MQNGGRLTTNFSAIGTLAGSKGTVTGGASQRINNGSLYVGDFGTGFLNINSSGRVNTLVLAVGLQRGLSGSVAVANGSLDSTNEIVVGYAGTGALSIVRGSTVTSKYSTLG